MDEMNSDEKERITLKIIDFITQELKVFPESIEPDLVINKGQFMLDSDQFHRVLARVADDTGFSMVLLRRVFPYDRYFITWQFGWLVVVGVIVFLVAIFGFFKGGEYQDIYRYPVYLSVVLWFIAFLTYVYVGFIRKHQPEFTITLFTETILSILNKYRNELSFDIQPHERQLWRRQIYKALEQYLDIFFPAKELSPELMMPFEDPDEHNLYPAVEACGVVMSLSFEEIDQSEIYKKYTSFNEDEPLTVVHFADILIDFWAEKKSKTLNENKLRSELSVNITDRLGYHE